MEFEPDLHGSVAVAVARAVVVTLKAVAVAGMPPHRKAAAVVLGSGVEANSVGSAAVAAATALAVAAAAMLLHFRVLQFFRCVVVAKYEPAA